MGLRLKAQLLLLFLGLYCLAFAVLAYFNLSLVSEDNQLRTEMEASQDARRTATRMLGLMSSVSVESVRQLAVGDVLVGQVEKSPKVRFLELYDPSGVRLFAFGRSESHFPFHEEAVQEARQRGESYARLWSYADSHDSEGQAIESLGPFTQGIVAYEYYHPIFDPDKGLCGLLHLSLEISHGPGRISVVTVGNLMLGAIFLVSSLLALNLWGEDALNRPMRGLVEAERRLKQLDSKRIDRGELISSNELVTVSRSFNRMALDLVKYQRELEEKTARLEEANRNYRTLNEQLEQKVEEKTGEMKEFFSLITHDLRIPLAAVAGYAELLLKQRSSSLTEKQEKFVRSILVANVHAQDLVRNLLDAMRYEFGKPQVVEQEFDLRDLVGEVVSHLSMESGNIDVRIEEGDCCLVYADRTRIGRVLTNLVGNAVRHCEGDARVWVRLEEMDQTVNVEVGDSGSGIPPELLPYIFEKFKHIPQLHSTAPSSGMGLGLYIVRRILEDHGRQIHVESKSGEGTRFWFELPGRAGQASVEGLVDE